MKKKAILIILFLFLLLFTMASSMYGSTKIVGNMTGLVYNEILGEMDSEQLYVYIDEEARTYIAGGDVFTARAAFSDNDRLKVINLLNKGLEWSKKAKEKHIEITKKIGSVKKLINEMLEQYNGIDLTFFSTNDGKDTYIVINIYDFENPLYNTKMYLDVDRVEKLISLLKKAPQYIKKLKEDEKNLQEFN